MLVPARDRTPDARTAVAVWLALTASLLAACGVSEPGPSTLTDDASAPPATVAVASADATPAAVPAPTASSTAPVPFTSAIYGYSLTLPPGWHPVPAILQWDGSNQPSSNAATVDKFEASGMLSVFGFAGPVSMKVAEFTADRIAANARDHGDTCPRPPEANEPIEMGGTRGVVLRFDCGILINQAFTIVDGVAYSFVLRDLGVEAAFDQRDAEILAGILRSLRFSASG